MRPWILLVAAGCAGAPPPGEPAPPVVPEARSPEQQPPAHTVGGFSVEVPPFTLQPGEERSPCWIFPLVVEGPSRIVGGSSLTVGPGMHHGNLTTRPRTGDGVRPCPRPNGDPGTDVASGGTVLFGSSTQVTGSEWQRFADGMGYRIKERHEVVTRMHYLNASSSPLTVAPRYRWYTIDEARVTREIAPFLWMYSEFEIPPRGELSVTGECSFQRPMHVVSVLPHMHQLAVALDLAYFGGPLDGKPFLRSPGFDPDNGVLRAFEPAVDLGQGEGVRFTCVWRNTFDKTIVEGIGDNEMCMVFGYAWPPGNSFTALARAGEDCVGIATGPPE